MRVCPVVRLLVLIVVGVTCAPAIPRAATAAVVLHFNPTSAYPGQVVRVSTASDSAPVTAGYLYLVRVDIAAGRPMRGLEGVVRVARLGITQGGRAYARFRVPRLASGYYTPAIGCRACANRRLILGGEHIAAEGRKDVLRIMRCR